MKRRVKFSVDDTTWRRITKYNYLVSQQQYIKTLIVHLTTYTMPADPCFRFARDIKEINYLCEGYIDIINSHFIVWATLWATLFITSFVLLVATIKMSEQTRKNYKAKIETGKQWILYSWRSSSGSFKLEYPKDVKKAIWKWKEYYETLELFDTPNFVISKFFSSVTQIFFPNW